MLSDYFGMLFSIILNSWHLILIGIAINILIEMFMPKKKLLNGFENSDLFTVFRASACGFLISGLSFGVVPIITALRNKGASASAIVPMLLFTPWNGGLGLMVIGGYLGFNNLMILLLSSFAISIISGTIFLILEKISFVKKREKISKDYLEKNNYKNFDKYLKSKPSMNELSISISEVLKNVFIAILFTGFFKIMLSSEMALSILGSKYSFIYAIPLATLIEIIGEGFSLFAGEMHLLGANLGAIFSIIMAGVITDINELYMLAKIFSKRSATAYLLMGLFFTIIFSIMI